jgi:hypothetical protein
MDYKPSNSTELISYRPNTDWTGVLVPEMEEFSFWAFKSDPTINKQLLANTLNSSQK